MEIQPRNGEKCVMRNEHKCKRKNKSGIAHFVKVRLRKNINIAGKLKKLIFFTGFMKNLKRGEP